MANLIMTNWYIKDKTPYIVIGTAGENNATSISIQCDEIIENAEYFLDIGDSKNDIFNTQELTVKQQTTLTGETINVLYLQPMRSFLGKEGVKLLQVRCEYIDNDEKVTKESNVFHATVNKNTGFVYKFDIAVFQQYLNKVKELAAKVAQAISNMTLEELKDTNIVDPTDGQIIKYDAETQKWINGEGGGGGGSSNYNELSNKPKINNVVLSGNKTTSDLGINIPTKTSELTNDSNFVVDAHYVHTDNNYDTTAKNIVDGVTSALNNKVDKVNGKGLSTNDYTNADKAIIDGVTNALASKANVADLATVATTGDYDDLLNKPLIPNVSGKAVVIGDSYFDGGSIGYNFANYLRSKNIYAEVADYAEGGTGFGKTYEGKQTLYEKLQNQQMRTDIANADVIYMHLGGNDMLSATSPAESQGAVVEPDILARIQESMNEIYLINPNVTIYYIPAFTFDVQYDYIVSPALDGVPNPRLGVMFTQIDAFKMVIIQFLIDVALTIASSKVYFLDTPSSMLVKTFYSDNLHPTRSAADSMFEAFINGNFNKNFVSTILTSDFVAAPETITVLNEISPSFLLSWQTMFSELVNLERYSKRKTKKVLINVTSIENNTIDATSIADVDFDGLKLTGLKVWGEKPKIELITASLDASIFDPQYNTINLDALQESKLPTNDGKYELQVSHNGQGQIGYGWGISNNSSSQFEVTTSGWITDTTSQSGSTLYKKAIAVTSVSSTFGVVSIGSTGTLPTIAQQAAFDLVQYVTIDSSVPCLYLYASNIPTDSFYIKVEGVTKEAVTNYLTVKQGSISYQTGEPTESTTNVYIEDYIPVTNNIFHILNAADNNINCVLRSYNSSNSFLGAVSASPTGSAGIYFVSGNNQNFGVSSDITLARNNSSATKIRIEFRYTDSAPITPSDLEGRIITVDGINYELQVEGA